MASSNYRLFYWPIEFRGCFVSYQFAFQGEALEIVSEHKIIQELKSLDAKIQKLPFMGPPLLENLQTGEMISQMPAIVLYTANRLGLMCDNDKDLPYLVKTVMDCNDLLMEICRYNGSKMWERDEWVLFRTKRLPKWMKLFEETLSRGLIAQNKTHFADICVYALFGNMTKKLPELESDLKQNAPCVFEFCQKIEKKPSLQQFIHEREQLHGNAYCGGEIEKSIRQMLQLDQTSKAKQ